MCAVACMHVCVCVCVKDGQSQPSINIHLVCSRKVINNNHSQGSGVALVMCFSVYVNFWYCSRSNHAMASVFDINGISRFSKKNGSNSWSIGQGRKHLKFMHRTPNKTDSEMETETKTEHEGTQFGPKIENSKAFSYFKEKKPIEKSVVRTNNDLFKFELCSSECSCMWFCLCFVCLFDTWQDLNWFHPAHSYRTFIDIVFSPLNSTTNNIR